MRPRRKERLALRFSHVFKKDTKKNVWRTKMRHKSSFYMKLLDLMIESHRHQGKQIYITHDEVWGDLGL